ncbi:MAG: hypothetical protein LBR58_04560 [Propionibacteriaceae bacterium]|jgi:hypothetical protein|nr:hypothetical protein [Propionibacteriaceae bacterium]
MRTIRTILAAAAAFLLLAASACGSPEPEPVRSVEHPQVEIWVGETATLELTIILGTATPKFDIDWEVVDGDDSVVSFLGGTSDEGHHDVRGDGPGVVRIRASAESGSHVYEEFFTVKVSAWASRIARLTVTQTAKATLTLDQKGIAEHFQGSDPLAQPIANVATIPLVAGGRVSVTVRAFDSTGAEVTEFGPREKITWQSSDSGVASAGTSADAPGWGDQVYGNGPGSATITASIGEHSYEFDVEVFETPKTIAEALRQAVLVKSHYADVADGSTQRDFYKEFYDVLQPLEFTKKAKAEVATAPAGKILVVTRGEHVKGEKGTLERVHPAALLSLPLDQIPSSLAEVQTLIQAEYELDKKKRAKWCISLSECRYSAINYAHFSAIDARSGKTLASGVRKTADVEDGCITDGHLADLGCVLTVGDLFYAYQMNHATMSDGVLAILDEL